MLKCQNYKITELLTSEFFVGRRCMKYPEVLCNYIPRTITNDYVKPNPSSVCWRVSHQAVLCYIRLQSAMCISWLL